jgi:hypothetical protein
MNIAKHAATLVDRLTWPEFEMTVPSALPVLFFGQLDRARVATVGLNPSDKEYLSKSGDELTGARRRFETLGSLGLLDRREIDGSSAARALRRMQQYFEPNSPVYAWFRPLERVLTGLGASFLDGSAVHLDLVQEPTAPTWSKLRSIDAAGAEALLRRDLRFLRWQLETFPFDTLVCTSRFVLDAIMDLTRASVRRTGRMALVTWTEARGVVADRDVRVVGWNIPLVQPTGLTAVGQVDLGRALGQDRV